MRAKTAVEDRRRDELDDPFEMANLYPNSTGLPMTVWISARGRAQHDVRVKASQRNGPRMDIADTAVVAVRPEPRLIEGELSRDQRELLFRWVAMNEAPLVALWEGEIDFVDFVGRMRRV